MRNACRIVVALLLASAAAGHLHHHRRSLAQVHEQNSGNGNGNGNGNGGGNGNGNNGNRNGRGPKFDFPKGSAKAFLDKMDPEKLQRILENAQFSDKSALARVLEDDPDLGIDDTNQGEAMLLYACAGLTVPDNAPQDMPSANPDQLQTPFASEYSPEWASADQPWVEATAADGEVTAAAGEVTTSQLRVTPGESLNRVNPVTADPRVTLDSVWSLSSRRAAPLKIWLDFRGCTITDRRWNLAFNRSVITTPAYSIDADVSSFSTKELSNIVSIWRAVSEDYAPFNVDVTTVNQEALNAAPSKYMRVCIGGNGGDALGLRVGGYAYVGVFNRSTPFYQPVFVFSDDLGKGLPKYVWEATSHEVGHTMGLSHDGRKSEAISTSYYEGANGWAPIMGIGYYQPLTQWSKGEFSGADNLQDDIRIIANKLRFSNQGNGNTIASSTAITPTIWPNATASVSALGVVQQTGAVDMFRVQAGAGMLTFAVSVVAPDGGYQRSNLKSASRILNSAGAEVPSTQNTAGPGLTGTAMLSTAGDYFIEVRGTGSGDPLTTGYSNYASLGQFLVTASFTAPNVTSPPATTPSPSPRLSPSPSPSRSSSPRPSPSPSPRPSPSPSPRPSPSPSPRPPSPPPPSPPPPWWWWG